MSNGVFKVGVTMQGFRTETVENVKIDAGVPTTANVKLELGSVSETVEVTGGAELVQTANATVNTTLEGRFVAELPEITRGGLDLLVASPGVQTAGANRNSSVNGLPNSALNVTLDGLNTQDQLLKSSNGFFVYIPITQDSIEEVTLTTSAAGAESTGEGAAQIKFITKSGTNEFHGGVFEQVRNTALDANYYYNNITGLPRDKVQLNQFGGHLGGPIWKNKLFFFTNIEARRQPESGEQAFLLHQHRGAPAARIRRGDPHGADAGRHQWQLYLPRSRHQPDAHRERAQAGPGQRVSGNRGSHRRQDARPDQFAGLGFAQPDFQRVLQRRLHSRHPQLPGQGRGQENLYRQQDRLQHQLQEPVLDHVFLQ